jgi:large subunit ribosomal protein L14
MIQKGTVLNVADNTGAEKVRCIGMSSRFRASHIGDMIKVSVIKAKPNTIKKGTIYNALIVRVKNFINRHDGISYKFDDCACVLLNDKKDMVGTRVMGKVARDIKPKCQKAISLAEGVF